MNASLPASRRLSSTIKRSGFTLVELLAVIAIIGVLVSLLLPSISKVKGQARETQCVGNFKQIGLLFRYYHDDRGGFPRRGVTEINPSTQRRKGKPLHHTVGGVNPAPFPYNDQYCQATNRPLFSYQRDPFLFRCPMDKGHRGDLDWPNHRTDDKPSAWETAGCSYLYNIELGAPEDTSRHPPLPLATLRPTRGTIASQAESWVEHPDRYILMNEPPAQPLDKVLSPVPRIWINFWAQWHRNRGRTDFRDPRIAPALFVSPVLFVDGHAAVHDFSAAVMTDPYYPYEATKDWIWYQPSD